MSSFRIRLLGYGEVCVIANTSFVSSATVVAPSYLEAEIFSREDLDAQEEIDRCNRVGR